MPTYLYEHTVTGAHFDCANGKEFETQQSIKEDAYTTCPVCQLPVKRLIAGGVIAQWKGGSPTPKHY